MLIFFRLIIDRPANPATLRYFETKCKLLKTPQNICCMNIESTCEHKKFQIKTSDYRWHNKCIIVASENATNGLFNFLLPLRAKTRSTVHLKPIILLLKNKLALKMFDFRNLKLFFKGPQMNILSQFPHFLWFTG